MSPDQAATHVVGPLQPRRIPRLGIRSVTRAHLLLERRPSLRASLAAILPDVASALGTALGCPVEASASLVPSRVSPGRGLAWGGVYCLVDLSSVGVYGVLELEGRLVEALLTALFGTSMNLAGATTLGRFEAAGLGHLCLAALAALRPHGELEQELGHRLCAVTLDRDEILARVERLAPHVAVEVQLNLGTGGGRARLLLPALPLQTLLQRQPEEPPGPLLLPSPLQALSVGLRPTVGRTTLPSGELDGLRPGDVLLCDGLRWEQGALRGPASLQRCGLRLEGAAVEQGLQIERVDALTLSEDRTMTDMTHPAAQMPVEVEVELTTVRLTLGELSRLRPGSLVPLHLNVAEPVVLKVGDRAVARAELVDLEGEVGARVLSLLPAAVGNGP